MIDWASTAAQEARPALEMVDPPTRCASASRSARGAVHRARARADVGVPALPKPPCPALPASAGDAPALPAAFPPAPTVAPAEPAVTSPAAPPAPPPPAREETPPLGASPWLPEAPAGESPPDEPPPPQLASRVTVNTPSPRVTQVRSIRAPKAGLARRSTSTNASGRDCSPTQQ
jgi:hypothetical protein